MRDLEVATQAHILMGLSAHQGTNATSRPCNPYLTPPMGLYATALHVSMSRSCMPSSTPPPARHRCRIHFGVELGQTLSLCCFGAFYRIPIWAPDGLHELFWVSQRSRTGVKVLGST